MPSHTVADLLRGLAILFMVEAHVGATLAPSALSTSAPLGLLAASIGGLAAPLFIAVAGFLFGRPEFLDIGLVYALINFIGTVAVLKLMHYGELGWIDGAGEHDDL